ncbi:MAG: XcyI family restriction endonuclease [Fimbriimonadaceae bacterium]|nr:XcyI family restriction endonuclease [Fimbriimonadaceae bacterium]
MRQPQSAVLLPSSQVRFWSRLNDLRARCLSPALRDALGTVPIADLDAELHSYVVPEHLARVASWGLRGEVVFATPLLLGRRPALLGYYRLLYGLSQKACYGSGGPLQGCRAMEEHNRLSAVVAARLPAVCRSLAASGSYLVERITLRSAAEVHELQLLTLGAMFDGSERNRVGRDAVALFWQLLRELVGPHLTAASDRELVLANAAGRTVRVLLADDPDVTVWETFSAGTEARRLSIEVKGGSDRSNVHNRLGEAEKSHQKARAAGFRDCWTILNATVTPDLARTESPSTGIFFQLRDLLDDTSAGYADFRDHLAAVLGIPVASPA